MKGWEEGFVPVLASLGIQSKSFISTSGRSEKKKDAFEMFSASPIFCAWEAAYLDSRHLIPATLNTLIIVLALLLKALLII